MDSFKSVAIFYAIVLAILLYRSESREVEVTRIVTFDLRIGERNIGSIKIGLFGQIVPFTVANFGNFSDGVNGYNGRSYRGSKFHRLVPGFVIQGGDIVRFDGTGTTSIYGDYFNDENFELKHTEPGLLSMANAGVNTNGCQFLITLANTESLDGKHVVFGKVIEGMDIINLIEGLRTVNDSPVIDVVIIDSAIKSVYQKIILKGQ